MTIARKQLVDPTVTRWYHCISRCVRAAFLMGEGRENRKQWVEDRLQKLTKKRNLKDRHFTDGGSKHLHRAVVCKLLERCPSFVMLELHSGGSIMTIARKQLVDPTVTRWYHCISRCVRAAFLMGEGRENRKQWVEDRLQKLTKSFSVSVGGFAVLDNHLHVLCRLRANLKDRHFTDGGSKYLHRAVVCKLLERCLFFVMLEPSFWRLYNDDCSKTTR